VAGIESGAPVPAFTVHRRTRELVELADLVADGPAVFHFYIFDFTGHTDGG
jgi:peroxiredoxin